MSIFISWSGTRSKKVALALRDWLPKVLQAADLWMSDADIEAGSRGINEVFEQLERATFGIIVITPGNREAPWLLFEAGALSKRLSDKSRVCPYLLDLKTTDVSKPLAEFQGVTANREGTLRLVKSINNSSILVHVLSMKTFLGRLLICGGRNLKRLFAKWSHLKWARSQADRLLKRTCLRKYSAQFGTFLDGLMIWRN
jgi:hypothetical protein